MEIGGNEDGDRDGDDNVDVHEVGNGDGEEIEERNQDGDAGRASDGDRSYG